MAQATALDRLIRWVSPRWAASRMRYRTVADLMARNYEAASPGRRTLGWAKKHTDANAAAAPALAQLRAVSRDLVRNNGWARNGKRVITRNVVGTGIVPKPIGITPEALEAWRRWSNTTECDAAGRLTFAGLQKLAMGGVYESGEMLVRRRHRRLDDGLAIPLQLQVLEPDYIDTSKHMVRGQQGGMTLYGIEFDALGRRSAYWLFENHPGSSVSTPNSNRVDARDVIHLYDLERAGQDRGVPWPCAAIAKLKDFDEFEDAQIMRQKIAALFAAIETDLDGGGGALGEPPPANEFETLEPGTVLRFPPGKDVKFANPPTTTDDGFSVRTLRGAAAAIGVTYEDFTGDYSQVNFSSARMSRIAHWGNVWDWQWLMMIPQFCDPAWGWAMDAAAWAGLLGDNKIRPAVPTAEWTPQPMPLTDPDKEARANVIMIRSGQKTLSQVIREQGMDPDTHLEEYAADLAKLDKKGIWLDSDVRRVSQAGLTQERAGAGGGSSSSGSSDGGEAAQANE